MYLDKCKDDNLYLKCLVVYQGCGPRKIARSPKVASQEILGAQNLSLNDKGKFFPVVQRQKLVCCGIWGLLENSPAY